MPSEKITSEHLEIHLAKYAFKEEYESQQLALDRVVDKAGKGLRFEVYGNYSQQEEGYTILKELLQSIIFVVSE